MKLRSITSLFSPTRSILSSYTFSSGVHIPQPTATTTTTYPSILEVMKQYAGELERAGTMEQLIPRKFTEKNLKRITLNQRFSQNNNHLTSLNKAFS